MTFAHHTYLVPKIAGPGCCKMFFLHAYVHLHNVAFVCLGHQPFFDDTRRHDYEVSSGDDSGVPLPSA